MIDPSNVPDAIEVTPEMKTFLSETPSNLQRAERRKFMTNVVRLLGKGGQRKGERELGGNRKTIIEGTKELIDLRLRLRRQPFRPGTTPY
jgi:hypothetical protein